MATPRGIANNNPGNIRIRDIPWQGKIVPSRDPDFETFDTPFHGLRALAINALSMWRGGARTVSALVSKWAPADENNTIAYIGFVADKMGVKPTYPIDFVMHPDDLADFVAAIVQFENGQQPYDIDLIDEAAQAALDYKP